MNKNSVLHTNEKAANAALLKSLLLFLLILMWVATIPFIKATQFVSSHEKFMSAISAVFILFYFAQLFYSVKYLIVYANHSQNSVVAWLAFYMVFMVFLWAAPSIASFFVVKIMKFFGRKRKCHHCSMNFGLFVANQDIVDQSYAWETIERTDDHYNSSGEKVGHTKRLEQVKTLETIGRNKIECRFCGASHYERFSVSNVL